MNYTTNYKLQKPLSNEKYNIAVANVNSDIIDSTLKRLEQKNESQDNLLSTKDEMSSLNSSLLSSINDEMIRAKLAEKTNADNITAEINRAQEIEHGIMSDLNAEISRAIATESIIQSTIDTNKTVWDDKYTKNEIDNKFSFLETAIDWKESVASFDDITIIYPNPQDGWTVNVKDTDYTYRYNGTAWVVISANAIPKATQEVDGLLSKEDKINYDDSNTKKHTHSNKSTLDGVTSVLITAWNSAVSHISDAVKHITSTERINWNDAYSKKHTHNNKSILDEITSESINEWNSTADIMTPTKNGIGKPDNVTIGVDANGMISTKFKVYTALSQLGLTAPITCLELATAMPDKSMIILSVISTQTSVTDTPTNIGILKIERFNDARCYGYFTAFTGNATPTRNHARYIRPLTNEVSDWAEDLTTSRLTNNLLATVPGTALDATQGKALDDKISELSRFRVYTDLSQIGLTAPKTCLEIATVMPNNSNITLLILSTQATVSDTPISGAGRIIIERISNAQCYAYFNAYDSTGTTTPRTYIRYLRPSSSVTSDWTEYLTTSKLTNNLLATVPGTALDATMGKVLNDKINNLNTGSGTGINYSISEPVDLVADMTWIGTE